MPLDGLRAWVAEVERKLAKRTRVFLALCVIAIGIAGAAVYLAIDARNSSVSESDVQELQRELEDRIDEGGVTPAPTPDLGTTPEEEPAPAPSAPNSGDGQGSGAGSNSGSGDGQGSSGSAGDAEQLKDLLDQARERAE